jgi:hypothetical protein
MTARIKLVSNEAERLAVYRFRYEVYVKEMKRTQEYADRELEIVCEPLDKSGHIAFAEDSGRVVGTARFNVGVDDSFGVYKDLYRLRSFGSFYPSSLSMTTKLIVAPEYRRSTLPLQLSVFCYKQGLPLGPVFDFIDCNPPLVLFFRKLGYRQVFPNINHPEYGAVIPLVLAIYDREHLESVKSPFARYCPDKDQRGSVALFRDEFAAPRQRSTTVDWPLCRLDSSRNDDCSSGVEHG